jgi:hypothetical protein
MNPPTLPIHTDRRAMVRRLLIVGFQAADISREMGIPLRTVQHYGKGLLGRPGRKRTRNVVSYEPTPARRS